MGELLLQYHRRCISGGHAEIHTKHMELGPYGIHGEWVLLLLFSAVWLCSSCRQGKPHCGSSIDQELGVIGLHCHVGAVRSRLFPFKWKAVQDRTIWGTFLLLGGRDHDDFGNDPVRSWHNGLRTSCMIWWCGIPWWQMVLVLMVGTQIMRLGMLSNVAAVAMLAPVVFAMAG